jgi:hypothetical protein
MTRIPCTARVPDHAINHNPQAPEALHGQPACVESTRLSRSPFYPTCPTIISPSEPENPSKVKVIRRR